MATIKLREINPVVFNNNVGLGDVNPSERLVINSGSIKIDHANGGQGILFQSLSTSGNNSSLRWSNNDGTERFRLVVDPDSDKTDRLQINSNNNATNCLTILQDGKVGIGTGPTAPTHKLEIKGPGSGVDALHLNKGTGEGGIKFSFNGTNHVSYIRTFESATLADNYMVLGVSQGDTTTGADVMRLMGDGKVGIGTGSTVNGRLEVYEEEGADPIINARRGKDGGRIRLSHGSTTDNYGEIGMTSHSSGSKIWIGSNMNSFAETGDSSPAHADVDNATWFSAWDSNSDQYTVERIANGQTSPVVMFSIDSDGRVNIPIASIPDSDTGLSVGDLYRSGTSLLIKTS